MMTPPRARRGRRPTTTPDARRAAGPAVTYRQLITRGFASGEAANLTAYLHRLPIADEPWTLRQVNAVLFLQSLRERGRFGVSDGDPDEDAA